MPSGETLQTVRQWAKASFPDDFAKFDECLRSTSLVFSEFSTRTGTEESQTKVEGVQVGTLDTGGAAVFAWRGVDSLCFGHEYEPGKVAMQTEITTPKINFFELFSWVRPVEDEVGLARFKALVRYISLTRASATPIRKRVRFFKEHFKEACREIVEQQGSRVSETPPPTLLPTPSPTPTPTPSRRTSQAPRVLRSAQLAPQRSRTPVSPTLASDEHLRLVDEALSSVRANVLAQIGAAQAASRRETAAQHSKIRELEVELRAVQSSKDELTTQATELGSKNSDLKAKLRTTEQAKTTVEMEHAARCAEIQEPKEKVASTEKERKEECDRLREKMAQTEDKARRAAEDAEMWKAKFQELKSDVLGAVMKVE